MKLLLERISSFQVMIELSSGNLACCYLSAKRMAVQRVKDNQLLNATIMHIVYECEYSFIILTYLFNMKY